MIKILLVEDDKSLREIYGVRLLAEGYDIVSAGDGEEALAMAIKERPSLILSDVMMPKISGFDMLDILRSTTETKDIKVIMMTALSSEDQRQRGEQLGADRYLVKSQVGIEDVVRTVHEVLGDVPGSTASTPPAPAPVHAPQPVAPQPITRPDVASLSPQPATTPAPSEPAPAAAPTDTSLPRPTAPFSSAAPRPSNLGDRVIHPLEGTSLTPTQDVAKMMEAELSQHLASDSPGQLTPMNSPSAAEAVPAAPALTDAPSHESTPTPPVMASPVMPTAPQPPLTSDAPALAPQPPLPAAQTPQAATPQFNITSTPLGDSASTTPGPIPQSTATIPVQAPPAPTTPTEPTLQSPAIPQPPQQAT